MSNHLYSSISVQNAQTIIQQIAAEGWPTGECVGSEQELMKRYGVGQASLRETARILEVQGIAAMYRGKGMLVASEPLAAAIRTLSIYLGLIGATVGEILEVRSAFGKLVSTLSTKRISSNQKREIKFALTKMGEATGFERMVYYSNLARILNESTGNPLLTLFQGAIEDFLPEETRLIEAFHHYDRIVAAFSAITEGRRDISVNYANEMALLEFEHDKARLAVRRPLQGQTDMPCDKLATTIASAMAMGITTAGMSPGERLGTEASLANYYGVARPTLRSAIRILSVHGRVCVQRGVRGGLVVGTLSPDFTFQIASQCISQLCIPRRCVDEIAAIFEGIAGGNTVAKFFLKFIEHCFAFEPTERP